MWVVVLVPVQVEAQVGALAWVPGGKGVWVVVLALVLALAWVPAVQAVSGRALALEPAVQAVSGRAVLEEVSHRGCLLLSVHDREDGH